MLKSILAAAAVLVSSSFAAPPEVRGTWLTTTANDAISTPAKTEETMRRLREIGLNTVYIECWKNGYTEYPSATMKTLIGVEMKVNGKDAVSGNAAPQRDLLAEATIQAHRNGMFAFAWLEYGFMAAYKDTNNELRAKKEWITTTRDGKDVGTKNSFAWLNPFHRDVQDFLINITLDAIRTHDLDGIQLDDRIALPVDLGYDPYTRELYRKETGSYPPDDEHDPKWMKWRADKISEFALRYVSEVRLANPDLIISVSPAPFPWSYENYLCDWMTWTRWCYCGGKRWNEYVPQCYRMDGPATIKSIQEQVDQVGDEKLNLTAGIRVVGDGPDMKLDDLRSVLDFTRTQEIAGHCLWFSRGILDVYPEELKQYYDVANKGHAANPFKPGDWRPMPLVATRAEGNTWKVNIKSKGRYRLVAKQDGTWSEIVSLELKEGEQTFVQEADAVELLVDRRP